MGVLKPSRVEDISLLQLELLRLRSQAAGEMQTAKNLKDERFRKWTGLFSLEQRYQPFRSSKAVIKVMNAAGRTKTV